MSVALVTGGNRGLGLEVCRQLAGRGHDVVLGSRDLARGERAAAGIERVRVIALDVSDGESVERAARELEQVDALINNAAILYDTWAHAVDADLDEVHAALETNLFGAWRTTQAFLPHLRRSGHGADRQRLQRQWLDQRDERRDARLLGQQGGAQRADAHPRRRAAP